MFFVYNNGLQPRRRTVLENIAVGALAWKRTITHRVRHAAAPEYDARVNGGDTSILGMVID